jgi:hypothetical protein
MGRKIDFCLLLKKGERTDLINSIILIIFNSPLTEILKPHSAEILDPQLCFLWRFL